MGVANVAFRMQKLNRQWCEREGIIERCRKAYRVTDRPLKGCGLEEEEGRDVEGEGAMHATNGREEGRSNSRGPGLL